MGQIQTLYIRDGVCYERRDDEMVKVEFCHLQYGNKDGREAISTGRWGTHSENMNEIGIDKHLTAKQRQNTASRDYNKFWRKIVTIKNNGKTGTKSYNRKTGHIACVIRSYFVNEEQHSCNIQESWSEKTKPFVGVLTVKGLDVLAVKHESGMEW